jgi:hypothetical protein
MPALIPVSSAYETKWKDYRLRSGVVFAGVFVWIGVLILYFLFTVEVDRLETQIGISPLLIGFVLVCLIYAVTTTYACLWHCPRCKMVYGAAKGFAGLVRKPWLVKRCTTCGLPKYYGSRYFVDFWGPQKARELADVVEAEGGRNEV